MAVRGVSNPQWIGQKTLPYVRADASTIPPPLPYVLFDGTLTSIPVTGGTIPYVLFDGSPTTITLV